jgi:signal transduction histidine kinase
MKLSINQDISFYQLVLDASTPLEPLLLSAATLLALVRAQIDLLIEQKISATLWVKLPPGEIWHHELARYQSADISSSLIYDCQTTDKTTTNHVCELSCSYINVQIFPHHQLCREYFLLILSPQFCSLILAVRPSKKSKSNYPELIYTKHQNLLSTINTFDGRIIESLVTVIKQATSVPADFIFPITPNSHILNLLLTKQLYHQEEINRQIIARQKTKLRQDSQNICNKDHLKDGYLTTVCHELRTPLTHIKTALSLLNSPNLKVSQRQRYLQMVNHQCDRQNFLISGLIDLVELEQDLETPKLDAVHLAEIIPGVVSTYQPLAQEKGITLACSIPPQLPKVWCVSGKLRQIAINLLHNSLKFTPAGGQVWVRAHLNGSNVQLEFRDTGIGIAESEIPKIFDLFYRVRTDINDDINGAGLGLTIVKQLLQHSGGSIYVQSKLNEGSIFIVNLASVCGKSVIREAKQKAIPEKNYHSL